MRPHTNNFYYSLTEQIGRNVIATDTSALHIVRTDWLFYACIDWSAYHYLHTGTIKKPDWRLLFSCFMVLLICFYKENKTQFAMSILISFYLIITHRI